MMSSNNPLKCNLGRMQPKQIDAEKLKREGWNNDGILIIKVDDERLSWPEKELIRQIGDKIYNNKTNNKNGEKHGK
jgi:hypothetical protein